MNFDSSTNRIKSGFIRKRKKEKKGLQSSHLIILYEKEQTVHRALVTRRKSEGTQRLVGDISVGKKRWNALKNKCN